MHIHCTGLNHTTAGLHLREQLAFSTEQIQSALARLGCGEGFDSLTEMVILSTCNRVEIYAVLPGTEHSALLDFLQETRGVERAKLQPHLYHYQDAEAVRHLFRVAAGLDSLVIGEPQILGQVTRSLELARGQGSTGPLLNRLFQSAIHAGKRARTETRISHNPASVASLAASLAERIIGQVETAHIAVLGAGEMAELAVEALRKRGAQRILVVNRTLARAQRLAERWGAEAATFEALEEALGTADILIASTGAPHTLVTTEMTAAAMRSRPQRPLVVIDIAVPRDVEPEVGRLPGVSLYDMDSLNHHLHDALEARRREVPHVESILEAEAAEFLAFLHSVDMLPLIADLGAYAERVRQAEVEKTLRRLPHLSEAERKRIEKMSQALVKKLLAPPIQRLRTAGPHAPEYATVTRALFGLTDSSST